MRTSSDSYVLGVLGLSGGVGASTVVAALAMRAAQAGRSVLLVDGHPLGGGLDLLLGDDLVGDLGWTQLVSARGELDTAAVLPRLRSTAGCAVLSWGRLVTGSAPPMPDPSVWSQLAGEVDFTVVDLPGPGHEGARPWLHGCTDVVAVVGSGVTRVAAAMVGLAALGLPRRGPAPQLIGSLVRAGEPPTTEAISRALDLPVLGVLRDDPTIERALRSGAPVGLADGPVRRMSDEMLAMLLVPERGVA